MAREDLRSLEENYDGEFSSYYGRSPETGETLGQVIERRRSRRDILKIGMALSGAALAAGAVNGLTAQTAAAASISDSTLAAGAKAPAALAPTGTGISFQSIPASATDAINVSDGYGWQRLLTWGDPIRSNGPAWDPNAQTAEKQSQQVGFNADFVWLMPLNGSNVAAGLLWNNHEYTDGAMMFRGYNSANPNKEQVDIELAAHGGTVMQVGRVNGMWRTQDSANNRRITATTPMRLSGPAAGDALMQTRTDPTGTMVAGMLNNCGGGVTPWGTILTAEENFNQYFANRNLLGGANPQQAQLTRYGIPGGASERGWERFYDRFDVTKDPNESNRFGWVVEIDPYAPGSMPIKRTALGRIKHEAAMGVTAPSGQYVVYTGDDERFEYLYKFITAGTVASGNRNLLDSGTLYVARFNEDGRGTWMLLVWNQGPLTPANGFFSQADVLIRTRFSADAVGATQMDRPEDVEVNPVNRFVYMALTNNSNRTAAQANKMNPVAPNFNGHIMEIRETNNNHAGTTFNWEIFLIGGDTDDPNSFFAGQPKSTVVGFSSPDNIAFDNRGNLWIATDGQISNNAFRKAGATAGTPVNDSVYAVPTAGPFRGQVRRLVNGVQQAEVAALSFNGDSSALFLSIQHPGEGGRVDNTPSNWPGGPGDLARSAVIVVARLDGGTVGS